VLFDLLERETTVGDDGVPVRHQVSLGHGGEAGQILVAQTLGINAGKPFTVPG